MSVLTVQQAAQRANVSVALVYVWCSSGQLAHYRLGAKGKRGGIRIDDVDLTAFLASCRKAGESDAARPRAAGDADDFAAYYQRVMDEVARKTGRRKAG